MICPTCRAENDLSTETCFTCGRALAALTQGSIIAGRYEVQSPLGRGGMGMVYKAHDRMLEETVAIKVLRSEFARTPAMAKRFRHEIKLARRVSHRNVCRIHEYGEDGPLRYISMEYLQGSDLKQELREKGPPPADEAFDIAIQVAEGLQAIHDVGIIHRDLKTPNLMRDARGVVRLMDFGIAKEGSDEGSGGLTSTGQVMGTPEYMSPEQCRGEPIDFRSDIYALGVVNYEIFTGQVPFHGDTPVATIFKHIQDPVPVTGRAAVRIPPSAVAILVKAMAKDRNGRFETAAQMAQALRQARAEGVSPTASLPMAFTNPPPPAPADPRTGPFPSAAHPDPRTGPVPGASYADRRQSTRLEIFVNFALRRVGTLGTVLQEERTIAENISRSGARVMTSMTTIGSGDIVQVEEIGGDFQTRAEVRYVYVGRDNIRRLNLRFLDNLAPDRLVKTDGVG
jgi:eukaryotic-like serine/threonine-protein kinase